MTKGRLYGVSLGPGDPGLITRSAWTLLLRPDTVWTYPVRAAKSDSYALGIVQRAGLQLPAQHSPLVFPMTHDREKLARHWLRAADTVMTWLQQGRDVLFLVEGDASTYSTFNHLSRTVQGMDPDAGVEVIAGVSSFHAAAARVNMPLTDVDDTLAVIPAGYGIHMIDRLLADFDSLVLLKVKPLLDDIIDLLADKGLLEHSCFVEKAGAEEERVVRDLASLKGRKVNYLSLVLVRNPEREKGEIVRGCRSRNQAGDADARILAAPWRQKT